MPGHQFACDGSAWCRCARSGNAHESAPVERQGWRVPHIPNWFLNLRWPDPWHECRWPTWRLDAGDPGIAIDFDRDIRSIPKDCTNDHSNGRHCKPLQLGKVLNPAASEPSVLSAGFYR